ncbi:putative beta-glucosidase M [Cyphellophora attinorum]|uniref:Probable beta-glucosidase M n=1 Tax=Cyphellophora attinorum TaxID=1664694 RepID=A0A0N1H4J9_9EURO|nr:putative beta-glucosidase M [Phialophora attinorum]KPI40293.1 putative beta-glucosidase M [Phialophora attinorum]
MPFLHFSSSPHTHVSYRSVKYVIMLVIAFIFAFFGCGRSYTTGNYTNVPDPYQGLSPPVYPSPEGKGNSNPQWTEAYRQARDLLSQLTLDEKVNLTGGHLGRCVGSTAAVPRVGWGPMCLSDGPSGIRDVEFVSAFPAGLTLGATFDRNLTYQYGKAIGEEYRDFGLKMYLGPMAGPLGRIARGGRNWEGFSNDPYLSGAGMGAVTKGIQSTGTFAVAKHWLGNEQEERRRAYEDRGEAISSNIDDRTLHELYAFPFMDALKAGAASVMISYQRLNNSYSSQNSALINGILKTQLGFEGLVMSDWNSQYAGVASAHAGLDLNMPDAGWWGGNLTHAVQNGSVTASRLDDMVVRQLAAAFYVQLEAEKHNSGYTTPLPGTQRPINTQAAEHDRLIREVAAAGTVLVKNANNFLPLKDPKFLTVYGYDAELRRNPWGNSPGIFAGGPEENFGWNTHNGTLIAGGGSGSSTPSWVVSPFHAITERMMATHGVVRWNFISDSPQPPYPEVDACLVFINAYASEVFDRTSLVDEFSDRLIHNLAANFTNVVVVIHNAGIRVVDAWIEHPNVTAVLFAGLPGQQAGNAIADVLWGDVNPSGRLPFTVAKKESDYGHLLNSTASDDSYPQDDFTEGLYIDYRAFHRDDIEPRFPFGFGLSYTDFSYELLDVEYVDAVSHDEWPDSEREIVQGGHPELWDTLFTARVRVRNVGDVAGHAVPQLYVSIPDSPKWQLRGFERVGPLAPGAQEVVEMNLTRRDLSTWDVGRQNWRLRCGAEYLVAVGDNARDMVESDGLGVHRLGNLCKRESEWTV